jgi:hypothetical protein
MTNYAIITEIYLYTNEQQTKYRVSVRRLIDPFIHQFVFPSSLVLPSLDASLVVDDGVSMS